MYREMAGPNVSAFQSPQEGNPLTIVMPRGYNQTNGFINQAGDQEIMRGLSLLNHPCSIQQAGDTVTSSCSGMSKENQIIDSTFGTTIETVERTSPLQKMQQHQFSENAESAYSFGHFSTQTDVHCTHSDGMALQTDPRNNNVTQMAPNGIVTSGHGSLELVNSLFGACGQMATLNTQQGQVFNVVILGDPNTNAGPSITPNIFQPGGGMAPLHANTNINSSVPPGTFLLAVAPTPINGSVNNAVNSSGIVTNTEGLMPHPVVNKQSLQTTQASSPTASHKSDSNTATKVKLAPEDNEEARETSEEIKREKKFACDMCDKTYYTSSHLKAHKRSHTGERPYICDICGNCYHRPETLSAHRRIHLGIKRFECEICGKKYGYYSHLNVHIKRVHKKLRPFSCETCGKAFTMKNNLRYHQKIHLEEKPHKCSECGRGFTYPTDLNRHMRGHTGEKKFSCDVCNKAFSESGTMTRHKRKVHSGLSEPGEVKTEVVEPCQIDQPSPATYECTECDKCFLQEQHLNFHKRTHHETKDKTVKCSYCPRLFETLRCARAHENRMHLLDRTLREKHECDICKEVYLTKKKLAEHKSSHYKLDDDSDYTNISSCQQENGYYKCNMCDREFAFPAGLIAHRFSHSNVRPYMCNDCGQSFKLRRYLTSHLPRCKKTELIQENLTCVEENKDHDGEIVSLHSIVANETDIAQSTDVGTPIVTSHISESSKSLLTQGQRTRRTFKAENCEDSKQNAQDSMNITSMVDNSLQSSVASLGNVVTSSGLVHVIILSNKNCSDVSALPTSDAALPVISRNSLTDNTVPLPSTVLSSLDINNDSNPCLDRTPLKQFTTDSPSSTQDKLGDYDGTHVDHVTLTDSVGQPQDEENQVMVESSTVHQDDCDPFSTNDMVKHGINRCISAVDDVSSTVNSDEPPCTPSSQSNGDNVVMYLSF